MAHEHPPLVRIYSGLIWSVARHFTDDLTAHRLGNILLVGVMAALLYKLVAEETNRWAGIASVVALFAMPRFFFHAHLIELDMPVAAMSVIVVYIFWRTKESARIRHGLLLGVAWGLALSVKDHGDLHPAHASPVGVDIPPEGLLGLPGADSRRGGGSRLLGALAVAVLRHRPAG